MTVMPAVKRAVMPVVRWLYMLPVQSLACALVVNNTVSIL